MNTNRVKPTLLKTAALAGWVLHHIRTDATTVIRLPGIYTVQDGRFVKHPHPHPREVIYAPGEELWLTVYSRHTSAGNEYMGEAKSQLVSDADADVQPTLDGLLAAAQAQPNQPYPLVEADAVYPGVPLTDPKLTQATREVRLAQVQRFLEAVLIQAAAEPAMEVSNLEVFVRLMSNRVETSAGIELEYPSSRVDAEICFIARNGDRVAEHTARVQARRFDDLNPEALVHTNAAHARALAEAVSPPEHQGPVVLTDEAACNFLQLSASPLVLHAGARAVYEKTSRYVRGQPVWGQGPLQGDALTLSSDPLVPYGVRSRIETDATPARRAVLVEKGRFAELHGTPRFYHYLGLLEQGLQPTGLPGNTVVEPGATPSADLLDTGRVVVVKAFSDFRPDPFSGEFASEIRLGEVRENGRATPFRGGLLVGNWFAALSDLRLSQETMVLNDYHGPSAIRCGNLRIAG